MISALLLTLLAAPQDDPFVRSSVEIPEALSGRLFWDVDADGRSDLVLFTYWTLWVVLQGPDGRFAPAPQHTLKIPAGTTLFAFADLDGDARLDLLASTPEGFRGLSLMSGETVEIALPDARRSLFHGLEYFTPSHYWHLFKDLVGGPAFELVLPTVEGFEIHEFEGPRRGRSFLLPYQVSGELALDSPGLEARLRKTTRVPLVEFAELDGQAGSEVLFSHGRVLATYALRSEPGAPAAAPRVIATDRLRLAAPAEGADPWFPAGELAPEVLRSWTARDLDADGHADLYRYDASRRAFLFAFGAEGPRTLTRPDRVLRVAGTPTSTRLHDVDGDRRPELILFEEKDVTEPRNALAFILGSQRGRLTIFRNRGGRELFAAHPSWVGTYVVRPVVGSSNGRFDLGLRSVVRLDGDLDGDGRRELVVQPRDGALSIHRGVAKGLFAETPWCELAIPSDGDYKDIATELQDLDADGRSDLVLHYRGWDGSPREKIVVLLSRL